MFVTYIIVPSIGKVVALTYFLVELSHKQILLISLR